MTRLRIQPRLAARKLMPLALAACLAAMSAPAFAVKGIDPADINKEGDACTDFYDYANGAWRKNNPIPDYMDRWSRRWQSGEVNKEHVRDILTEVSARTDWPKGSPEQLSGDFYAVCMNEAQVDKLGIKPMMPMLEQIRAIEDREDLQRVIEKLHAVGVAIPFSIQGYEDLHDPTQVVAHVFASGLGLPDRDYYLKPDKRFVEAREKYLEHVAKMFVLAGASEDDAKAHAQTVFDFEKRLAEASLDNVALRDPKQQDHKIEFAGLEKMAPSLDWDAYFDAAKMPKVALNVTQPKFLEQIEKEFKTASIPQWKTYLEWQLVNAGADLISKPFVEQNFAFYGKYLTGATEMKPRWKRCAEFTDNQLGEALGKKYVEKHFPPAAKARMQEMVKYVLLAMKETVEGLEWMTEDTKKQALEKIATFNPKIGYPDKWKTYEGVVVGRDSYWDNFVAA